jgi:outer membrane protein TolC
VPERLDITESWTSALNSRPDWKQLNLEAEKLKLNKKFRWNQRLPEVGVFGGYGRSGTDASRFGYKTNLDVVPITVVPPYQARFGPALDDIYNGVNPRWNVGVGVRIPLSNYEERNRYRSAEEQVKQVEVQLNKLRQDIIFDVDNAMDSARASYERVGATHQARLYAELALDGGQKRLDAGVITSFEVLSLQKDLTTARSNEARALADYNEDLVQLFYRDGSVLERNKISVKFK